MNYDALIAAYMDGETQDRQLTEDKILALPGMLDSFIHACELELFMAPPGFVGAVMSAVQPKVVPFLSRRLAAAACFCSAAAIILISAFGIDREFMSHFDANIVKISEIIQLITP